MTSSDTRPDAVEGPTVQGEAGVDYDVDPGECFNCFGEGYVYGCSWEWQCDTWDGDSCLCTRPCHICHPPKDDPEMRKLMGKMLGNADAPKDDAPEADSPPSVSGSAKCAQVPQGENP